MPATYQAPRRADQQTRTKSQSLASNTKGETATVERLITSKGNAVISIAPDDTLGTAVEALRDHGIGALMVTGEDGALKGILSERDIVRKLADAPGKTLPHKVSDIMTRAVETCTPDEELVSVLRRMTAGRFRHMPVTNGTRLLGMVTIGDVVNYRLTELEHEALQLKQMIVG
ncbi:CBS domain-containing protein [Roseobacteraceae bacterium S113]